MKTASEPIGPIEDSKLNESAPAQLPSAEFRRDLAFPTLSDEMTERLRSYGREEMVPADTSMMGRSVSISEMPLRMAASAYDAGCDVRTRKVPPLRSLLCAASNKVQRGSRAFQVTVLGVSANSNHREPGNGMFRLRIYADATAQLMSGAYHDRMRSLLLCASRINRQIG